MRHQGRSAQACEQATQRSFTDGAAAWCWPYPAAAVKLSLLPPPGVSVQQMSVSQQTSRCGAANWDTSSGPRVALMNRIESNHC